MPKDKGEEKGKEPLPAIRELVRAGKLKRVDVVLVHTRRSPVSWAIRFGTKSYWNHSALVYVIRTADLGYEHTFIIESGYSGVDIHNIEKYLAHPGKQDVAIKRCEAPWFANDERTGGMAVRRRVRGFTLDKIDASYDYGLILRIAKEILGRLILGGRYLLEGLRLRRKAVRGRIPRLAPERYICSGFAQWAYYKAVQRMILEGALELTPVEQAQIVFNPEFLLGEPDEGVLLATTPADLAQSANLTWKYLVLKGQVYDCEKVDYETVEPTYRWYDF